MGALAFSWIDRAAYFFFLRSKRAAKMPSISISSSLYREFTFFLTNEPSSFTYNNKMSDRIGIWGGKSENK